MGRHRKRACQPLILTIYHKWACLMLLGVLSMQFAAISGDTAEVRFNMSDILNTKYVITNFRGRTFCAQFENDVCTELYPVMEESLVGNIYIGRVENVVKNMNCAFVEIQKGVKAFYPLEDNKRHIFLNRKNNTAVNQGDFLLVQVCNDAVKTKPATVTSKISLSGKYVVLSSDVTKVNISSKTRKNLKCIEYQQRLIEDFDFNVLLSEANIAADTSLGDYGFILRTNSAETEYESVYREAVRLVDTYAAIIKNALFGRALTCLYNAPAAYVENILSTPEENLHEIITDDRIVYDTLKKSLSKDTTDRIRLYNDKLLSLKNLYSLESELESALKKKVWLKCGGYLVIEPTEALTVIDVNSGKCVSKKYGISAKEDTISKVNLEAAKEIAKQIRLRNISGIIVVDFINMKFDENNVELLTTLKRLLKNDSVTCSLIDITKLGLVEITRRKNGKTLAETLDSSDND